EDGIRDRNVTGVQTCALPILLDNGDAHAVGGALLGGGGGGAPGGGGAVRRGGRGARTGGEGEGQGGGGQHGDGLFHNRASFLCRSRWVGAGPADVVCAAPSLF